MKPHLEHWLRAMIRKGKAEGLSVRDVIADMKARGLIDNEKQAWRTLEKWSRRRTYEYGVSLDLGWLVDP